MILAFDTETTGLDVWHGCRPFIVSAVSDEGTTSLWRFRVDGPSREVTGPNSEKIEIYDLLNSADLIVCHNAKFDVRMLENIGVPIPKDILSKMHDTIIMSHCVASRGPHGLKELALKHLDILDDDETELRKACLTARRIGEDIGWRIAKPCDPHWPTMKTGQEWWKADCWMPGELWRRSRDALDEYGELVPREVDDDRIEASWETVCEKYAVRDVERTLGLYYYFLSILEAEDLTSQYEVRRQQLRNTYEMETRGVSIRLPLCKPVREKHEKLAEKHAAACLATVDYCIDNLNSAPQLQAAMYQHLALPIVKRTPKGQPSTDKDVIAELKETLPPNSAGGFFIRQLSAWRKRDHAAGTVESYERGCFRYPGIEDYACLHPNFNITGTDTTRESSSNPNGQNIAKGEGLPKEEKFNLRDLFGPYSGRLWYSHDYNNQEMRIFAYSAEERDLIDAFERGEAVHLIIAKELYSREFDECDRLGISFKDRYKATLYQWVKNGNFSLIYGAGQKKADLTYHYPGAYKLIRKRFKQIDRFMRHMHETAKANGFITILGGYRLQVPYDGPHKAVNYFVQGSAGWAMSLAMNRIREYLDSLHDYYMIMNVHDELLHDVPEKHDPAFPWKIKQLMEKSGDDLGIPLPCEMSLIRTSWHVSEDVSLQRRKGPKPLSF